MRSPWLEAVHRFDATRATTAAEATLSPVTRDSSQVCLLQYFHRLRLRKDFCVDAAQLVKAESGSGKPRRERKKDFTRMTLQHERERKKECPPRGHTFWSASHLESTFVVSAFYPVNYFPLRFPLRTISSFSAWSVIFFHRHTKRRDLCVQRAIGTLV